MIAPKASLSAGRDSTIDRQMRQERFNLPLAHQTGVNPSAGSLAMKSQKLFHPPEVGLDRAYGKPSHLAGRFKLLKQLHMQNCRAQELLGQFALENCAQVQNQEGLDTVSLQSILNANRVDKK